jgi:quinol monooxygenase YgiN
MSPGCTVIATFFAKPDKREELRDLLMGLVSPTRAEAGCVDYHLHVEEEDPNVFLFYENWRTVGDLDEHLTMPYLAHLRDKVDGLIVRPIHVVRYEMLSRYDK